MKKYLYLILLAALTLIPLNCHAFDYMIFGMGGGMRQDLSGRGEFYLYFGKNLPNERWRDIGFGVSYERFRFEQKHDRDLMSRGFGLFVDYNRAVFTDWFFLGARWDVAGAQWFNDQAKDDIYMRGDDPDNFVSMGLHMQAGIVKPVTKSCAFRLRLQPGWYFFRPKTYTDDEGYEVSYGSLAVKKNKFAFSATFSIEFSF